MQTGNQIISRILVRERVQHHLGSLLRDERGIALILTLSMLAILSVIGAYSLTSTNTDLRVTSNFRSSRQALSAAERAINYAQGYILTDAAASMELDDSVDISTGAVLQDLTVVDGDGNLIDGSMDTSEENTITYIGEGAPPEVANDAGSADDFIGIYFRVSTTGQSNNGLAKARAEMVFFGVGTVSSEDDESFDDTYGASPDA